MSRYPNPLHLTILAIGLALARLGLIDRERAVETTNLAWPRIVTGIARMSKNAVDVAMVGVALGSSAIGGVGVAGPYWGLAFALGGGVAGGTIALVSQRYGANAYEELGRAVRSSALLAVVITLPVTVVFWLFPVELISLIADSGETLDYGATYLQIVGLGIPLAALNLVGSRTLVGADDAYTAMQVRAGGAVINIGLNAVFIFGLEWEVAGAALGTVLSNLVAASVFAVGIVRGRAPLIGAFPVQVDPFGTYVDREMIADVVSIGTPIGARGLVWTVAEFPMLAIVGWFGEPTLAAFVIARRIWGLMNTPGWGFGLAASSLVGQALGKDDEGSAEAYGRDIVRFAVATYALSAVLIAVFADRIVVLFAENPTSPVIPIAVSLVYAACFAALFQGVAGAAAGPLDASGDTRIPFLSQALGMFGVSIPLAYLGATTGLGYWGLYLAFVAETSVPAAINYWRFRSNKWKAISEGYRPDAPVPSD